MEAVATSPPRGADQSYSAALGDATNVVNIGAGASPSEPPNAVVPVEPSQVAAERRPPRA